MEIFVFDGSLEGLLTSVFDSYERKSSLVKLVSSEHYLPDVFQSAFRAGRFPTDEVRVS